MAGSNLDLSGWTWDEIKAAYPDIYAQYGPGSAGYQEPPAINPNIPGQSLGGDAAHGATPQVPNPAATQAAALGGNLENVPQLYALAQAMNPSAGAQQEAVGQGVTNATGLMSGQVPPDVIALMQQQAAERGVATGSPGGANSNAAYLRALGQTSLGLQQTGLSNLKDLMGMNIYAPLGLTNMLVTPEQQQAATLAANIYKAAPDPAAAAAAAQVAAAVKPTTFQNWPAPTTTYDFNNRMLGS